MFLAPELCNGFRNAVNSSPAFSHDQKYMQKYNLFCAVMDRLDTCVRRLNTYGDYPASEDDFIIFMVFSCMVKDAVTELLKALEVKPSSEDTSFFEASYRSSHIYNPEKEIPSDDKFFEYLRSLMFAHPFETSRAKFLRKGEIQYSPWVIVNRHIFPDEKDTVGVRIYSNLSEEILDVFISFSALKDYVSSKYAQLTYATQWVNGEISQIESEWELRKVDRTLTSVEVLQDINDILISRFSENYEIQDLILYLTCPLTEAGNGEAISRFRNAVIETIPSMCDAVDALDNERLETVMAPLFERPKKMHKMANYQLEKIFCYLEPAPSDCSKWRLGRSCAKAFAEGFAKKYVSIDTDTMDDDEIRLLVRTACYLEAQEQEG